MLTNDTRLRPNDAEVAAEVMDGEAILINLATGAYYSMDKAGGLVWQSIQQHCSLEEIAQRLTGSYAVSIEQARADATRLVSELLEAHLVTVSTDAAPSGDAYLPPPEQLPYESPTMSAYSDLRNLLALDPPMPSLETLQIEDPKRRPSTA
jgi:hypothetical protein